MTMTMNFFNPTPNANATIIIYDVVVYIYSQHIIRHLLFSIHDMSYIPYQFFTPPMILYLGCISLHSQRSHPTQNRLLTIMKYTTTVLALAVVVAKSVDGQRRNFRTLNKGQMRRRELQDGSMSMLTAYKGTGDTGTTKATGSSSDETESCADKLTGSWSATEEDICKLFTINDGSVKKTCSRNQAFTFDVDSETDTLQMTSNFIRLSSGEKEELTLIGFINDKDGTCSFTAVSVSSSNTIEGSVGEDGVLHVEVTKPGVDNDSAAAFQGLFTKIPDGFPFISFPIMSPFVCFAEGEECRSDEPDTVNGGCNSPNQDKFGSIVLGETKCGSASTYIVKEGRKKTEFRDTDWYKFDHAGGTVSAILRANFGLGEIILEKFPTDDCEDREVVALFIDERDFTFSKVTATDLPAGRYVWIVTEDRFGNGDECGGETGNDYTFTIVAADDESEIEAASESGTMMKEVSFDNANPGSFKPDEMDGVEGATTYDDEEE